MYSLLWVADTGTWHYLSCPFSSLSFLRFHYGLHWNSSQFLQSGNRLPPVSVGVLERCEGCSPTQISMLHLAIHSLPTHSGMDPSMGYSPSGASLRWCESFMGQFPHECPCPSVKCGGVMVVIFIICYYYFSCWFFTPVLESSRSGSH